MTRNFCTYFDKNYLYRGLTLYRSLEKHCPDFVLYILCFDDITRETLEKLNLNKCVLINLNDFEDGELLEIKPTRTLVEYYWTCTPSLPLYVMNTYKLDLITYLDADLMFFSSPEPIFEEFGDNSILLTEHRYYGDIEQKISDNGKFNVQYLTFRNDQNGLSALNWWRQQCLKWCYNRHENGMIGDQAYLNDWEKRFKKVHLLKSLGGGLAPWNVPQYKLKQQNDSTFVEEDRLIFYHFHAFRMFSKYSYDPALSYEFSKDIINYIYKPYIAAIKKSISEVKAVNPSFNYGFVKGLTEYLLIKAAKKIKG